MVDPEVQKERSFEIGMDESWKANLKRLFDEFLDISLETARRDRTVVDKFLSDSEVHFNNVQTVALQALQNAVETANMVGKQAVRHADIAIDCTWDPGPGEESIKGKAAK